MAPRYQNLDGNRSQDYELKRESATGKQRRLRCSFTFLSNPLHSRPLIMMELLHSCCGAKVRSSCSICGGRWILSSRRVLIKPRHGTLVATAGPYMDLGVD